VRQPSWCRSTSAEIAPSSGLLPRFGLFAEPLVLAG
jgi:hypothetical protein